MGIECTAGLALLEEREMATVLGGGDGGESLARDIGHALGFIAGAFWYSLTHQDPANYAYAKVGYAN